MGSEDHLNFDRWLGQELKRGVGSASGPSPRPGQARYASLEGGLLMRLTSRAAGLFSAKLTAGLGLAGLVLVGGAVAAAATTGSTHPDNWGKVVTTAVQECKAKLTDDQHGIGQCVSAVASQKRHEERGEHSSKPASPSHPTPVVKPSSEQDGQIERGEKSGHPGNQASSPPDRPGTEPPGHEPSPHPGNPGGPPHR